MNRDRESPPRRAQSKNCEVVEAKPRIRYVAPETTRTSLSKEFVCTVAISQQVEAVVQSDDSKVDDDSSGNGSVRAGACSGAEEISVKTMQSKTSRERYTLTDNGEKSKGVLETKSIRITPRTSSGSPPAKKARNDLTALIPGYTAPLRLVSSTAAAVAMSLA